MEDHNGNACQYFFSTMLEVSTLRIVHGSVTMRAGTPRSSSHPTPGLQTAGSRARPRLTASALVPWSGPAGRSPWRSSSTRQSIICSWLGRWSSSCCSVLLMFFHYLYLEQMGLVKCTGLTRKGQLLRYWGRPINHIFRSQNNFFPVWR